MGGWVVVVSRRLLSLNPTTVMVVLLLVLWLLLGCDNIYFFFDQINVWFQYDDAKDTHCTHILVLHWKTKGSIKIYRNEV